VEDERDEDVILLQRASQGDAAAFATLHDRYAPLCRRRAWDVLRDRELADDAVQEAFVDLWRTAANFDHRRAAVRTWLCVLVHRRSVDLARREARRRRRDQDSHDTALDPRSYTAEELLVLTLDRRDVQEALTGLGKKHREVIELAYYGGLTQTQLAARLNIPLGTVKSRTQEALAHLSRALVHGEPISI
jgi:RNA polymerase sigma-70 factor (ECF subfamily)